MRFPSMISSSATLAALCSLLLAAGGCGEDTSSDGGGSSAVRNGGTLGGAPAEGAYEEDTKRDDPGAQEDGQGKITICHVPPGNPANAHSLTVSVNGWNGHQRHKGDYAGPCNGSGGEPDAGVPACLPEGSACLGDGPSCCAGLQCGGDNICRTPVIIN